MKKLILKLNDSNSFQKSPEAVKLSKVVSSISPLVFIKLFHWADNEVNPRSARVNKITKSIQETLQTSPELFWFKSKGILLATESCKILERNRVEITLENKTFEGIMDGGHNALAIANFIIETLFGEKSKTWEECKQYWNDNYSEIVDEYQKREAEFKFSIPIEIISPNEEDGAIEDYYDYIAEICSARNNNVQLTETAKGNQVGYYDYLKTHLNGDYDIIWKPGDSGNIKADDVISLSTIPLIFLQDNQLLPDDIKALNRISIYSQKGKCIDFYNSVLGAETVSKTLNGKYSLNNSFVESALEMTTDILKFFDQMYIKFPDLYHRASPGKFGRISSVTMKESKVPFHTTDALCEYTYPPAYIYPLMSGLTSLMEIDESTDSIRWRVNPTDVDLMELDLTQYVNIIKLANFDPQKIGKGEVFYREAAVTYSKVGKSKTKGLF